MWVASRPPHWIDSIEKETCKWWGKLKRVANKNRKLHSDGGFFSLFYLINNMSLNRRPHNTSTIRRIVVFLWHFGSFVFSSFPSFNRIKQQPIPSPAVGYVSENRHHPHRAVVCRVTIIKWSWTLNLVAAANDSFKYLRTLKTACLFKSRKSSSSSSHSF